MGPKYQSTGSSPEGRNRALSESTKVLTRATGSRIETGVLKRTGSESIEASKLYIYIYIYKGCGRYSVSSLAPLRCVSHLTLVKLRSRQRDTLVFI